MAAGKEDFDELNRQQVGRSTLSETWPTQSDIQKPDFASCREARRPPGPTGTSIRSTQNRRRSKVVAIHVYRLPVLPLYCPGPLTRRDKTVFKFSSEVFPMLRFHCRCLPACLVLTCGLIAASDSDCRSGHDPRPEDDADQIEWSELISAELLEGGVKVIRSSMDAKLKTLGTYDRSHREIPVDATSLALLAHIAMQHPGEIGWKDQAGTIRVLARSMVEITTSARARGRKSFAETREAFQTICRLLDGEELPRLPEANAEAGFSEFAAIEHLMKRNDRSLRWVRASIRNPDELKENSEQARRDFTLLALTGAVIPHANYGYEDDEEFSAYAQNLTDQAKAAAVAAGEGDFDELKRQQAGLQKTCTLCLGTFR